MKIMNLTNEELDKADFYDCTSFLERIYILVVFCLKNGVTYNPYVFVKNFIILETDAKCSSENRKKRQENWSKINNES